MAAGRLVPDDVVNRIVAETLAAGGPDGAAEGGAVLDDFILDGYPRTVEQAAFLSDLLAAHGADVDAVVSLRVPQDHIVQRLSRRRTDRETGAIYHLDFNPPPVDLPEERLVHRPDDQPEAIRTRLRVYHDETAPLEQFFRARVRFLDVDGVGTLDAVRARVDEALATLRHVDGL
jgi:adenylate kinase